ncbi:MAG: DUF4139 domain-containing protein [Polyangiaceae bacterium]
MRTLACLFALGALLVAGCGGSPKPVPVSHFSGPAAPRRSTAAERQSVAITVYNQNFGLVREVRRTDVGVGKISLEFRDVAARIQPATVHVKSLTKASALSVFEQNYRYDLLSPQKLLEKYVDKKVKVIRVNEATGREEETEAEVLSTEGGAVLRMPQGITYGFPGRIAFPEVPQNLIAKPTLVWLMESTIAKQDLEVTYITGNLNWEADYVLVVNDADTAGDLTGWVTLTNKSGASYENAALKLVAGDVQRLADDDEGERDHDAILDEERPRRESFKEEGLFEYHLYALERPTSILDNEQKQVTLLEAEGIHLEKHLIFQGGSEYYRRNVAAPASAKVAVYLYIQNRETNHLGMALPKGVLRVYKADKSGAKQFIGEERIDHTPRDEEIRVKLGDAFDVVSERRRMDWKAQGTCASESSWEVSLRNHKDEAVEVEVREPVEGDWTILSSSQAFTKKDSRTFVFNVKIAARGETKLTYRVRTRWC